MVSLASQVFIQLPPSESIIPLNKGESICVEPGGMLANQGCSMKTGFIAGSIFQKLKTFVLGGESLIRNTFTAEKADAWVALEEHLPGQIIKETLTKDSPPLLIRRSALLTSSPNVELETQFLGLSGYMQGKGVAVLRATVKEGSGDVRFHAHDGVVKGFHLKAGDGPIVIDNDMVLAYSDNLKCTLKRPNSQLMGLLSGEGFVCEFEGDGIVYVSSGSQTGNANLVDATIQATATELAHYIAFTIFTAGILATAGTALVFTETVGLTDITSLI